MGKGHFLKYVPLMLVVSFIIVSIPKKKEGTAVFVGYEVERKELGQYKGAIIEEEEEVASYVFEDKQDLNNGKKLKDNGSKYAIKVNKRQNVVTIYEKDEEGWYTEPVKAMICSVGLENYTPDGVYRLGERYKWLILKDGVYGQYATTITGNILFHSVPYFTQNKNDLEVKEYNKLGEKASAGCVRLAVVDARWIYDNCDEETLVDLFESDYEGPLGKPIAAKIEKEVEEENWDPTDPDPDSPYMDGKPKIFGAYDRIIERGEAFDIMSGISAINGEGEDVTSAIKVESDLDIEKCGTYQIVYMVKDGKKKKTSTVVKIEVQDHVAPVVTCEEQTVTKIAANDVNSPKQLQQLLLQNVKAYDGNEELNRNTILVDYSDILDKKYGKCQVKYQVNDQAGNLSKVLCLVVDVDVEPPVLHMRNEMQGDVRVSQLMDDAFLLSLVDAKDNSGNVDLSVSRPLTYVVDEPYNVIYCAKDSYGNVSTINVIYQIKE